VARAQVGDGVERPRAEVGEALAAGEAHLRRRLHPTAVEVGPGRGGLVVGAAFELAEVELPQSLVDAEARPERRGRLDGAPARARVDGIEREGGERPGEVARLILSPAGEADVEAAVAAAARLLRRLGMADEEEPHATRAAKASSAASSL